MTWNWQQDGWPNWTFDNGAIAAMERQYLLASGRLQGAWQHLDIGDQVGMKVELLSAEAMKTSEIEGEFLDRESVQSSIRRHFGLKADRRSGPAEAGIASLMIANHEHFAEPLSHEMLFDWHKLVCNGRQDLDYLGEYRGGSDPMEVVSGPIGKRKVHFEAPASNQVHAEMTRFIDWFNNSNEAPLTKSALAHLWFVVIHPFEDGNGRIARAISDKALAMDAGSPALLALSHKIGEHRKGYYEALERSNTSLDATNWLKWFGDTVLESQEFSGKWLELLIRKTKVMDEFGDRLNARQLKAVKRMFDAGPDGFTGGLSAKNYISLTDATTATTTRDLAELVDLGILVRTGERRGTRYWLAEK